MLCLIFFLNIFQSWLGSCYFSFVNSSHCFVLWNQPVRLDADTSGLLLFSSNGPLTHLLLDPITGVERVYEAVVVGDVLRRGRGTGLEAAGESEELQEGEEGGSLREVLSRGVKTTEGVFPAVLLDAIVLTLADSQVPITGVQQ